MLLMTVLMAIASAEGKTNESSNISFNAFAGGKCVIKYGDYQGEYPIYPATWFGIGKGTSSLSGYATCHLWLNLEPVGDIYDSDKKSRLLATGENRVSFAWEEPDGSKHRVDVEFRFTRKTTGVFIPDVDGFLIPNIQGDSAIPLQFKGEHQITMPRRRGSGLTVVQRIKGIAFSGAWYVGTGPLEELDIEDDWPICIGVQLLDMKSQTMFSVVWGPIEGEHPTGPPNDPWSSTILVPKASRFRHSVEVLT